MSWGMIFQWIAAGVTAIEVIWLGSQPPGGGGTCYFDPDPNVQAVYCE
jgi:hypothetical protein